jgi:hypothetical protein
MEIALAQPSQIGGFLQGGITGLGAVKGDEDGLVHGKSLIDLRAEYSERPDRAAVSEIT